MVALIQGAVTEPGGIWADLGAGTGNFTWALREVLGEGGVIYAIDRDARAVTRQRERLRDAAPGAAIYPMQADVTRPLQLPQLDGILMANLLHFIGDQVRVLTQLLGHLRPGGRLLLVEYDFRFPVPWVPYPVDPQRFAQLAAAVGLSAPQIVGTRRSPSSGRVLYAAVALKAAG